MRLAAAAFVFVTLAAVLPVAAQDAPPQASSRSKPFETKDRVNFAALDELLSPAVELADENKIPEAEAAFSGILQAAKEIPGFSKINELDDVTDFAVHLCMSDHPEASFPYLRTAVDLAKVAFGPDHPETALAYTDLGDCLAKVEETRRGGERREAYKRSYEIRLTGLGEDNPETLAAARNYAELALDQGAITQGFTNQEEMLSFYSNSVSKFEKFGAPYRFDLAISLKSRALALLMLGRPKEANEDMERMLALGDELDVADQMLALSFCQNFSRQHRQDGDIAEADRWRDKCAAFSKGRLDAAFALVKSRPKPDQQAP